MSREVSIFQLKTNEVAFFSSLVERLTFCLLLQKNRFSDILIYIELILCDLKNIFQL